MRYVCGSSDTEPFSHSGFLGTRFCADKLINGSCENEKIAWFFTPGLGGLCLLCVHALYSIYFNRLKEIYPDSYADMTRHESLPMSDEVKRDLLIYDLVCNLYTAELVEKWLISGGQLKKQTIFEKDCNVIKHAGRFEFQTYEDLIKEFVSPQGVTNITAEEVEQATLTRMERFMEMFRLNASEMNNAYDQLKEWRFHLPPKDDVFERKFQVTEMIDLKFPQQK
jgi:hypothetical protein